MSSSQEERELELRTAKEEEPQQDFEADAFLSLLKDEQILMGGFDLDEAIAETEGLSRPNSGDGEVAGEELMMRLEMEGEEPLSDAEGDDNEKDDEEWPPRDPNQKSASKSEAAIAELTQAMMARVGRMARKAEEQAKNRTLTVTSVRLDTGECFNPDDWSSEELKELYDGVKKFGTSKPALVRVFNHSTYMSKNRTIQDVYDKLEDIRSMNKDYRQAFIQHEKRDAHDRGVLRFQEMGKLTFIWSQQMQKLQNSRAFTRRHEYVRDQLMQFFTERVRSTNAVTSLDDVSAGPHRPIRWSRLYRIARFVFSSSYRVRSLPVRIGINAMEAGVLLLIMNDIQKAARANLTDRMRAENGSVFLALAHHEYKRFNLDVPVTDYAKPFLDPLGVRDWRDAITEEAPEEGEMTYNEIFPAEETSKGKKRTAEDLGEDVDKKRRSIVGFVDSDSD